jgi:hypothetical protein
MAGTCPEEKVSSMASCPSRATLRSVPSTSTVTSAALASAAAAATPAVSLLVTEGRARAVVTAKLPLAAMASTMLGKMPSHELPP